MNTLLQSVVRWVKDPFGKKKITKHNTYIHDIYTAEYLARQTKKSMQRQKRHARVYGGVNSIDRSVLGTYHRKREEV